MASNNKKQLEEFARKRMEESPLKKIRETPTVVNAVVKEIPYFTELECIPMEGYNKDASD